MKYLAATLGILSLLTTNQAFAITQATYNVTITSIEIDDATGTGVPPTYLTFSGDPGGKPSACTQTLGRLGSPTSSSDSIKALTSLATAALLSGKSVKIWWQGTCVGTGTSAYPYVSVIAINQ